jgi:hypothetical protein
MERLFLLPPYPMFTKCRVGRGTSLLNVPSTLYPDVFVYL